MCIYRKVTDSVASPASSLACPARARRPQPFQRRAYTARRWKPGRLLRCLQHKYTYALLSMPSALFCCILNISTIKLGKYRPYPYPHVNLSKKLHSSLVCPHDGSTVDRQTSSSPNRFFAELLSWTVWSHPLSTLYSRRWGERNLCIIF